MMRLNKSQSLVIDWKFEFYADHDEDSNMFGVFGASTGFCYFLDGDKGVAEKEAKRMNEDYAQHRR